MSNILPSQNYKGRGTNDNELDDTTEIRNVIQEAKIQNISKEMPFLATPLNCSKSHKIHGNIKPFGFLNYTKLDDNCLILLLATMVYAIIKITEKLMGETGLLIGSIFGIILIIIFEKYRKSSMKPSPCATPRQCSNSTIQTFKIWFAIFNFLDYEDILALRQTNRAFNKLITGRRDCIIWRRGRIVFPKKPDETISYSPNTPWHILFDQFKNLQLVQQLHCPNIRFCHVDLRTGKIDQFFTVNGSHIRELNLEHCHLTIPTFRGIVKNCIYLNSIKIIGSMNFLIDAPSLFPGHATKHLAILQKLELKCTVSKRRSSINFIPVYNISPNVIEDLISSSDHLKHIEISGFGFKTVLGFINSLGKSNKQLGSNLTLIFQEITSEMEAVNFHQTISRLKNINLVKLELGFQEDLYLNRLLNANNNNQPLPETEYELIDSAINQILIDHGNSIEELNLNYVQVSEGLLNNVQGSLPKLRKLKLHGTRVENLVQEKTPPNLRELIVTTVELPGLQANTNRPLFNNSIGFKNYSLFDYATIFMVLLMSIAGLIYIALFLYKF